MKDAISQIEARYKARTARSEALHARSERVLATPGSRGGCHHAPYPLTLSYGSSWRLVDVDGNEYIDAASNMFSLIHGTAFPPVMEAVRRQMVLSSVWTANSVEQIQLAELLAERVPAAERVVFCNSGTEAFSLALQLCRVLSGRPRFVMLKGGYHGSSWDALLAHRGIEGPGYLLASAGPEGDLLQILHRSHSEICGLFVEGVQASNALAAAPPRWWHRCTKFVGPMAFHLCWTRS